MPFVMIIIKKPRKNEKESQWQKLQQQQKLQPHYEIHLLRKNNSTLSNKLVQSD